MLSVDQATARSKGSKHCSPANHVHHRSRPIAAFGEPHEPLQGPPPVDQADTTQTAWMICHG